MTDSDAASLENRAIYAIYAMLYNIITAIIYILLYRYTGIHVYAHIIIPRFRYNVAYIRESTDDSTDEIQLLKDRGIIIFIITPYYSRVNAVLINFGRAEDILLYYIYV